VYAWDKCLNPAVCKPVDNSWLRPQIFVPGKYASVDYKQLLQASRVCKQWKLFVPQAYRHFGFDTRARAGQDKAQPPWQDNGKLVVYIEAAWNVYQSPEV